MIRGYDPKHKILNSEVELIHDLEPFEVTDSDAEKFKEHGDKCDIWGGAWLTYTETELKSRNVQHLRNLFNSVQRVSAPCSVSFFFMF